MTRAQPGTPNPAPGAILYIRQSITRRKKDAAGRATSELDTISPELQEHAGRTYCQERGYRVTAVIADLNRTGRTLARRRVQEAISLIQDGTANVIVVWKWSRLARSRRDFAITCAAVEDIGGRVESSTEPTDTTTAIGRLNRGMLAEIAAFESDRAGEIIKEIHDNRVSAGMPGNGRDRFGYRKIAGKFQVDPETGPILRAMYEQHIGGKSNAAICRWVNAQGIPTTYGYQWSAPSVRITLDSGFGAGLIRHRGQFHPGIHEPVITATQWNDYLAGRKARTRMPSRAKGSPYVLSSLVKCGICGKGLGSRPSSRGRAPRYYCLSRMDSSCPSMSVAIATIEAAVLDWLRDHLDRLDAFVANAPDAQPALREERDARLLRLQRLVAEQHQALTKLTVDHARGLIPDDAYVAARDAISDSRDTYQASLDSLASVASAGPPPAVVQRYRSLIEDWDITTVESRRNALRELLQRVVVWRSADFPLRVEPVPTWTGMLPDPPRLALSVLVDSSRTVLVNRHGWGR